MSVKACEDALAQKGGSPANTTNAAETGKETPQK